MGFNAVFHTIGSRRANDRRGCPRRAVEAGRA
jgi:hypothetical protein